MKIDLSAKSSLPSKHLLQLSLWGGVATVLWILGLTFWFDGQAREIWLDGRRFTASLMADGLSNAMQNNLVSRNYAELELHLKQAVSDSRVKSALVTDPQGKVLSHVNRADGTPDIHVQFGTPPLVLPDAPNAQQESGTTFVQWLRMDSGVPLGWLRLELHATKADEALVELRQRFIWVFALASLVLLGLLWIVTRRAHQLVRLHESSLLQKQEFLEGVAYRDSLTQLANRHMLLERLTQEIAGCTRYQERLFICFLDLDGFKEVNDSHGHDAGDEVLREVGRRLRHNVRENDTVARLGGDEFVLVLARIEDSEQGSVVFQRILQAICAPIQVNSSHQVQVSASMGVTVYPEDDSPPGILIEHADQAMYVAKRQGKNKWVYHDGGRKAV